MKLQIQFFFSFSAEVRSGNNYLSISRVNQAPFLLRNGSNKMTFWANKHPNFDIIQCKKFQGLKNCRVGRKWSVNLVEKNPLSIKWMQIIMMMKFRSFFNYCSSTNIRWFAEGVKTWILKLKLKCKKKLQTRCYIDRSISC